MALDSKILTFTANTGTGTQDLTGTTFTPKAAIVWWSRATNTVDTFVENASIGYGFTDGTTSICINTTSEDNQAAADTAKILRDDAIITTLDLTGTVTTVDSVATFSSWLSNGMRINWTDAPAAAFKIHVLFLGGSDITNVKVGKFASPTATGNQDITTPGFTPDGVLFAYAGISDTFNETGSNDLALGIGAGTDSSNGWGQYVDAEDGRATMDTWQCYSHTNAIVMPNASTGTYTYNASYSGGITNGFRLNWGTTDVGNTSEIAYLAIKGCSIAVGNNTEPGSTGNQTVTTSKDTKAVMIFGLNTGTADAVQTDCMMTIGGGTSSSEMATVVIHDTDNTAAAVCVSRYETDSIYLNLAASATVGSSAILDEASLSSVSSTGFVLNWSNIGNARPFRYIAFGNAAVGTTQVTATKTHKYNITGKVTESNTHKYNIIGRITATKTHKYNIIVKVSTTKTHKYNILDQVTESNTHKYNIIGRITATKTHKYNIIAKITATRTHKYNMLEFVHECATPELPYIWNIHKYNILNAVSTSKTHKYNIIGKVTRTRTHKYHVEGEVTTTKTHLYNVVSKVTTTKTHKYNIIAKVSTTKTHKYNIIGKVVATTTHKYNIIAKVTTTKTHKYNVVRQVTASKIHVFNVIGKVISTKTHKYNVLNRVTESNTHKYNILEQIETTKTHKYNIIGKITKTTTHKYDVEQAEGEVSATKTHKYHIEGKVSTTKTHKYNVLDQVTTTKTHKYNVTEQIENTKTHKYNVTGKVTTTKTHLFNVVRKVTASKIHVFSVITRVTTSKSHLYNILNAVSTTKTHKYNIIAKVNATKTHKYNIQSKVTTTKTHKYNVEEASNQVTTTKTHLYNILAKVTTTKTHKSDILDQVTRSRTHKYNIIGKISTTKTHKFNLLQKITKTTTHKSDILVKVTPSPTKTHKYNIISKITRTRTHKYNIVGRLYTTRTHKYQMGGKVRLTTRHIFDVGIAFVPDELGGSTQALIKFPERVRIIDIIAEINNKVIANLEIPVSRPPANIAIATVGIAEYHIVSEGGFNLSRVASAQHKLKHRIASTLITPQVIDTIDNRAIAPYIGIEVLEISEKDQLRVESQIHVTPTVEYDIYLQGLTQIKSDKKTKIRIAAATMLLQQTQESRVESKAQLEIQKQQTPKVLAPEIMTKQKLKTLKTLINLLSNDRLFE